MRFLHLADLHLDAAFQNRSRAVREALRGAAKSALSTAVDQAIARRADAVLIAGDLFDSERLSIQTERFLLEALARLSTARIQVVYATGNHDSGGESKCREETPLAGQRHGRRRGEPGPRGNPRGRGRRRLRNGCRTRKAESDRRSLEIVPGADRATA